MEQQTNQHMIAENDCRQNGITLVREFVGSFSERNCWCEVDYKIGPAYWNYGDTIEALRTEVLSF